MAKFLTVLLLLVGAFGAGYYVGQRPVGTLQQTVADLQQSLKDVSRNVVDTTLEIERDLRRRQGLVEAKARLVQTKTYMVERHYADAAKELTEAIDVVAVLAKGTKADTMTTALRDLTASLREVKLELTMGTPTTLKKLDELLVRMDQLLSQ